MSSTPNDAKNKKNAIPKVLKDLCWKKWIGESVAKNKCMCCEMNEITMNSFHCGHVLSEANGGKLSVENLRPICVGCNLSMGTENMASFKERCGFGSAESLKITIPKDLNESSDSRETPKESKVPKPKKEKVKEEIIISSKDEPETPKESEKNEKTEVPKPKKEKKKVPILPNLTIDPNHVGLKQEHYKVLNEELKGFLFKTDNDIATAICIGKLPIKLIESIPEDYEYNLEELSEKDSEALSKFERPYKFEGKKKEEDPIKVEEAKSKKQKDNSPKETNEGLVWEEGLLKKKLPKYLEVPELKSVTESVQIFEKMKAEMEGLYRFLAENVYKRIK